MKSWFYKRNRKKTLVYFVLFLFWIYGARTIFVYAWQTLKVYPKLARLSTDEKRFLVDGPLYVLLRAAQDVVPVGSKIYFLNPAGEGLGMQYRYKMAFHLPARHIESIEPNTPVSETDMAAADFVLLMGTLQPEPERLGKLKTADGLEKIFEYEFKEANVYHAIYRVKK